jgi:hypothetical protein
MFLLLPDCCATELINELLVETIKEKTINHELRIRIPPITIRNYKQPRRFPTTACFFLVSVHANNTNAKRNVKNILIVKNFQV